ncbi:MAG: NADH-quinone oxidoreductase subunit C [Candidatus Altiarchaeota archaeon]
MTYENQPVRAIEDNQLLASVEEHKRLGYRLVQISCTALDPDRLEVTYSFDKDLSFENLRVTASKGTILPSISGIFKGSFLYENEIKELFGLGFKDISVDYNGTLYKKRKETPFAIEEKK